MWEAGRPGAAALSGVVFIVTVKIVSARTVPAAHISEAANATPVFSSLVQPRELLEARPSGQELEYLAGPPKPMPAATALDLWTVPVEESGDALHARIPEPFLKTPALESQAAFSPDGHWLAYCSTESGSWEVYVQPFPPTGAKVEVSSAGGRIPFWSPNGRDLFYATERQQIRQVSYAVHNGVFVAGPPVEWTKRRFADTGVIAGLDLAGDGKRFAALFPVSPDDQTQSPNHVTGLLNFFDEVQRRVAAQK